MKAIKNNFYMMGLMWKACPSRVVCEILQFTLWRLSQLVYSVWLLQFILQAIENGFAFGKVALMLVGILTYSVAAESFRAWFTCYYQPKTNIAIQEYLLTKVYKQAVACDLSCYENPKFYDKYTRANEELLTRGTLILENFSNITSGILEIIICMVIIAAYEPRVLPIVFICAACAMAIDTKRTKLKYEGYKQSTPHIRKCDYVKRTVFLQDYAKEMRLGEIFFPLMRQFNIAADAARSVLSHYFGKSSILRVVREIFMNLGIYLITQILIVYRYFTYNAYPLSIVITIINASTQLQHRIFNFGWHVSDFIENGLYVDNIREFLNYKPIITENENGAVPKKRNSRLTLRNVSFTYEGQNKPCIKNISIDLPHGSRIALVGHNGAGKSTLVKLLMRLYDVTEGEILLDGKNIKEYKLSEYRKIFSTVFQDFKIFATTVTENVLLQPPKTKNDEERAVRAVNNAGLSDKISRLKNGMSTHLTKEFDDEGVLMSGGEFQKIAVSRVFAGESEIAILDEPSSALDPISEYEIFNNMMQACAGKTIIFISHRLSSAVAADKIFMMEYGEIIEEGSHSELMEQNGKYAEMFKMQAEKYQGGGDLDE